MEENRNAAYGITDILIDSINKKYDGIRDLNSLKVNLDEENFEAMIPVIDSIVEDENNNIGKLQQLIDLLSNSEDDIEEGKQETIEIIDNSNEFVESITSMKKKLILSENFDNVIDDVQAVADPVFVGANEEHDENKKKYEDAIEENKKEAEETIPKEGETGEKIKSKSLKQMHLSEKLFDEELRHEFAQWCAENIFEYILNEFVDLKNSEIRQVLKIVERKFSGSDYEESLKEDLSFDAYDDFNHELFNAISDVCFEYRDKNLSRKDIEAALEWFENHFFDTVGDDEFEDFKEVDIEDEIVEESLNESIQCSIAKEQIKRFTEGKMPKNWNVDSYLKRLTEKNHINEKEATSLKKWYTLTEAVVSRKSLKSDIDLSDKEKSMTKVLSDNIKLINDANSKEDVLKIVKQVFDDAKINTKASQRLIQNISKQNNTTGAQSCVLNSILKGSGNGVI